MPAVRVDPTPKSIRALFPPMIVNAPLVPVVTIAKFMFLPRDKGSVFDVPIPTLPPLGLSKILYFWDRSSLSVAWIHGAALLGPKSNTPLVAELAEIRNAPFVCVVPEVAGSPLNALLLCKRTGIACAIR